MKTHFFDHACRILMFGDEATASFMYYGLNVHAQTCAPPSTLHWRVLLTVPIHRQVSALRPYIKAMAALHLPKTSHKPQNKVLGRGRPPSTFHYSCSTRMLPIFDGLFVISAKWRHQHQSGMKIALHVVCKEGTVDLFCSHGNYQRITVCWHEVMWFMSTKM